MNRKRPWAALFAVMCAFLALTVLPAHASGIPVSHVTRGQHTCSYTNPEYMLSDWDMDVYTHPGTSSFSAYHTPIRGYEDAYWVTGYHNENSTLCDRRHIGYGVYGHSWVLPAQVRKLPLITADFRASGQGRIGFDIWLTADRRETGPSSMERDWRTWEILLEPVHRWTNFGYPGWNRVYLSILPWRHGVLDVRALDLTRIIRDLGVPGSDWLMAVDAGGETPYGNFTVWNYALHIGGQHPKPYHRHHHKHHGRHHPRKHRHARHHHHPKHHRRVKRHHTPGPPVIVKVWHHVPVRYFYYRA